MVSRFQWRLAGLVALSLPLPCLPVAEPDRPLYRELNARNVKAPPRFEVRAPAGAPNVEIVLIDDLGFGAPSAFGGPVSTPTLDRLAATDLRYNTCG